MLQKSYLLLCLVALMMVCACEGSAPVLPQLDKSTDDKTTQEKDEFFIPDEIFRSLLKTSLIPDAFRDEMLKIKHPDVATIKTLDLSKFYIHSLDGIQFFTELQELNTTNNPLKTLDLSKNTKLATLTCSYSLLTTLDLSKNTALKFLDCAGNELGTLDLSANTALEHLDCRGAKVATLLLPKNASLKFINCSANQLSALDLSDQTELESLSCPNNQLTSLKLPATNTLQTVGCGSNYLDTLDVSKCTGLWALYCARNKIRNLTLATNTKLQEFWCEDNPLVSLNMTGIREVYHGIDAAGIRLSPNAHLTTLKVHTNLKDDRSIKEIKEHRKEALTISTYKTTNASTMDYTLEIDNYVP